MTAVVDASAAVLLLLSRDASNSIADLGAEGDLHAPSHFDIECLSALRRALLQGAVHRDALPTLALAVSDFPVARHTLGGLVPRILELMDNASMYDAAYVALAEGLGADLWTADQRLAGIPGITCEVRLI